MTLQLNNSNIAYLPENNFTLSNLTLFKAKGILELYAQVKDYYSTSLIAWLRPNPELKGECLDSDEECLKEASVKWEKEFQEWLKEIRKLQMNNQSFVQLIILEQGFDKREVVNEINEMQFNTSDIHIMQVSTKVMQEYLAEDEI